MMTDYYLCVALRTNVHRTAFILFSSNDIVSHKLSRAILLVVVLLMRTSVRPFLEAINQRFYRNDGPIKGK